jgi:teichoic acid glycerol-phosphate primase
MAEKKGVILIPSDIPYYLDHLTVVGAIMNTPLLCVDEKEFQIAKKYYPDIEVSTFEYNDFNPESVIANYDVLFSGDPWDKKVQNIFDELEKKYRKKLRYVFCPHGFSDKGFYFAQCAEKNIDIMLIYGQNMLDLYKHYNIYDTLKNYVIVGNYRKTYFNKHRQFYDKLYQEEIGSHFDKQRPTILYAPTWMDSGNSTYYDVVSNLLDRLPSEFNMIVKLHPKLEEDDVVQFYKIIGKYEKKPNLMFLTDFPPVYTVLAHSDIFIGDMSSVGYDFLSFNKPMFFLNKSKKDSKTDRSLFLYRCGVEIMPEQFDKTFDIISKSLPQDQATYGKIREDVYRYTFGEERPFADIKKDIIKAYS